jgi:tRNA-specific 2-thiouridylase
VGRVLSEHYGIATFRVGQKLEYQSAVNPNEEWFVMGFQPSSETVIAGEAYEMARSTFLARRARWIKAPNLLNGMRVDVFFDPGEPKVPAFIRFYENEMVRVDLETPVSGIDPEQTIVFYHENEVLGSAQVDPEDASRWAVEHLAELPLGGDSQV